MEIICFRRDFVEERGSGGQYIEILMGIYNLSNCSHCWLEGRDLEFSIYYMCGGENVETYGKEAEKFVVGEIPINDCSRITGNANFSIEMFFLGQCRDFYCFCGVIHGITLR